MSNKKAQTEKIAHLIEYLEPLSDIRSIDVDIKKKHIISISGRFVSATNKRLVVKPYSSGIPIYVDLYRDNIDTLEVKTVRKFALYENSGENVSIFKEKEKYDKSIVFWGGKVGIIGRFLKKLAHSMEDRKLEISTTPVINKPENHTISTMMVGDTPRKKFQRDKSKSSVGHSARTVLKNKEFFFKEKLSEVNDAKY